MAVPDKDLMELARRVALQAYSPYSKVRVGAALRAADGRVFHGCNVENASFGLTVCAERSACIAAVAEGATKFEALAIWTNLPNVLPPCGACRQFLAEFGTDLSVIVEGEGGERLETTQSELLPNAMGPDDLP